jgi:secondary thiamine-phosphate synthase enzyme
MVSQFSIRTTNQTQFIDITRQVQHLVSEAGVKEGICLVYIPHTTAAVTINEAADPAVTEDILMEINKIIPFSDRYKHSEGNSAAHIKASLFGASCNLPIIENRLALGTWQGIYFCEFDGPRQRQVLVTIS